MNFIQNLSIQVLPINSSESYKLIDEAIEIINSSGLRYKVTPFNTVVEGQLSALQNLITEIQKRLFELDCEEGILNFQLHFKKGKDVFLNEKTDKFEI